MARLQELIGTPTAVRLRRFATVGAGAAAVQEGLLWTFVEWLGIWYVPAAVVAIEITIILQYVVNNSWTFRPSRHATLESYARGMVRTNIVRGSAIPIQTALLYALVTRGGFGYLLANLVAIFITGFYRYYLDSRWTWRV